MKKNILIFITVLLLAGLFMLEGCSSGSSKTQSYSDNQKGWISLFNGKNLDGWKASHPEAFKVEDGHIVAHGRKSHLYYEGPVKDHNFKDFEFKADVMTKPGSNSGIYFHTKFQSDGFPEKGFEVQVNNSGTDWIRTGSLYSIYDFEHKYAKDNQWFSMYIKVQGKNVKVKVNGKQVVNWTQPKAYVAPQKHPQSHPHRYISHGTFALQIHSKGDTIYFKNIKVKPLP
jgi:hypothetical protein